MHTRNHCAGKPAAATALVVLCSVLYLVGCNKGPIRDEAMLAHRTVTSFPPADEDYFADMDRTVKDTRVALSVEEVRGRNMWNVWTGGDDKFWDTISRQSVGTLDLLKIVSSYDPESDPKAPRDPKQVTALRSQYRFSRSNRWSYLGLINEPCFTKANGPDPEH